MYNTDILIKGHKVVTEIFNFKVFFLYQGFRLPCVVSDSRNQKHIDL